MKVVAQTFTKDVQVYVTDGDCDKTIDKYL